MNFKAIIYMGAVLAVALLPSCKKDDDKTSTKDYLSGTFTFDIPVYLAAGQTVTLVPSGVTIPGNSTDAGLGYYWYSSWDSTRDTTRVIGGAGDGSWTIKTPLEIGCYKVTGVAFGPSEYYTSSGSVDFYVVDPSLGTTVSGLGIEKGDPHYLDLRDIKTYYTTEAGDLTWMKNNLGWNGAGKSYRDSEIMDDIFGRFYSWEEARQACPEGWRLPSDAEFAGLASSVSEGSVFEAFTDFKGVAGDLMVNASFLGDRMWEFWPQVPITNKAGFCAIPVGYAVSQGDDVTKFTGAENYAAFWTSDEEGDNGFYRYFYVKQNDVLSGKGNKASFRASVRCVKER